MEPNTILEHIDATGAVVENPPVVVTLTSPDGHTLKYGFFLLPKERLEDAILFRITSNLLNCSCVDTDLLSGVQVDIELYDGASHLTASYNPETWSFEVRVKRKAILDENKTN